MNGKIIKIVGIVATILGLGASVVTDWVSEKKMEELVSEKVDEKIKKALATDEEENEDEEKAESL